jgi:hypothetical protein
MAIPKPITRVEQYLASIAGASDVTLPAYPITREEYYLASWAEKSGFEIAEVDGTPPLVLKDCIGEQFKGLVLYGKSTQVTTTGTQLIDINSFRKDDNYSVKIVNNYSIELTSTIEKDASDSSKVYSNALIDADILVGKTITMSYDEWNSNVPNETAVCGIVYNINGKNYYEHLRNSRIKTVTIPLGAKDCKVRLFLIENASATVKAGTYTAIIKGLMICEGTVAKSWEPYTGGKPPPSPDYPQEIKSAGDGGNLSVIVKNPDNERMQSVSFSTPNGLPGIPVDSDGNYTDQTGQQWICDEVDLERGVYVQRVKTLVFADASAFVIETTDNGFRFNADASNLRKTDVATADSNAFCSILPLGSPGSTWNTANVFTINTRFYIRFKNITTLHALDEYFKSTPMTLTAILIIPIETPLSETDIAAYRALATYKGTTILESECYLKVKYSKLRK